MDAPTASKLRWMNTRHHADSFFMRHCKSKSRETEKKQQQNNILLNRSASVSSQHIKGGCVNALVGTCVRTKQIDHSLQTTKKSSHLSQSS